MDCCFFLLRAAIIYLFGDFSKLFYAKSIFLVLCSHWSLCSVVSVVREWPDSDFFECLDPIKKRRHSVSLNSFNRRCSGRCFSQRGWNNDQHLCWPLIYPSRQKKTHNLIFGGEALLPTLAPANPPGRQAICPITAWLKAEEWRMVAATETPKFTKPSLHPALPWMLQGSD